MEELRQFLVRRDETRQGLARAGFGEVVLSPCDGPRDMVQRMNAGEFDLVFATAIVYAQLAGAAYEPVLQFKRPGDDFQMPGREGVFRQGIIFAGPGSALFKSPGELTREELRKLLERVPLAVPTADSAAGYLAPRYKMEHDLGLRQGPAPLFCGSDSEVVKHVVAGLAEVGACPWARWPNCCRPGVAKVNISGN
jgi:ABC-type phosphate/phosphonate transport system substrate-binding protein